MTRTVTANRLTAHTAHRGHRGTSLHAALLLVAFLVAAVLVSRFALVSTFSRLSKKACLVARTRTSAKEHLIVQVVTGALVHVDANPLPSNPKPTQPPTKPPPTTTTTNNIACNNDQILVKNADGTSWCETYAGGECVLASMLIVSSSCRQ